MRRSSALVLAVLLSLSCVAAAVAQDGFYDKRQVRLVIGNNVGTSYDLSARLVARHLGRHIPGQPQIVPQNMPGASGLIATNYVYGVAPQDGSVVGAALQSIAQRQIFGDENAKFEADKLRWIGNPTTSVDVIVTWHSSRVKTIDDARRIAVPMGSTTKDAESGVQVALANNLLGTRFRLVTGYKGGDIDLAMERGEVEGRAGQSWDGWKLTKPNWVAERKLNVVVQIGLDRAKDLPDVPLMTELAPDANVRAMLELLSAATSIGRPLFFGPGVPAARVSAVRGAFRATMADSEFLADAAKANYKVQPVYGEDLQAIVARMLATPAPIIAAAKEAMAYRE
ncbi:MAG: Bug family tripartite tricarboxylate transporter substrate binding protein [Gemmatimonas sp.]